MAKTLVMAGITYIGMAAIKANQDKIKTNLTSLDQSIHDNAVQCLIHAAEHGDASPMRRLLVDTLDKKNSGYRVAGLVNWMRKHSPMELRGSDVNLSGTLSDGVTKRKFDIAGANAVPFWKDSANDEVVAKPVYRDSVMGTLRRAIKSFKDALENTNPDGSAKDPSKPFYVDDSSGKVESFFDSVNAQMLKLVADNPDFAEARHKNKLEAARIDALSSTKGPVARKTPKAKVVDKVAVDPTEVVKAA